MLPPSFYSLRVFSFSSPSFSLCFYLDTGAMSVASSAPAMLFFTVAQAVVAAHNTYTQPIDERVGKLGSGGVVYLLRSRSRNLHISGALLLREALLIYQTYALIFVYRESHKLANSLSR